MTVLGAESQTTAALVQERLEHALARYGDLADEVGAVADDPFEIFARHPRLAELRAEIEQAAGRLGLALIRHVTAGGQVVLRREPEVALAIQPKATQAEIEEFEREFSKGGGAPVRDCAAPAPHVWLQGYLNRMGVPCAPKCDADLIDAVEHLEELTGKAERELWKQLPDGAHVTLVECLVAWVRGLQQWSTAIIRPERLDELFRQLAGHRREEEPGYVYGLRRHDLPHGPTWFADAQVCLDVLHEYAFEPHPVLSRVEPNGTRRASTRGKPDEISHEASARTVVVGEVLSRTEGMRAAIVGGSRRPERQEEIARALKFAELDWIETEHPTAVDRLVERIRGRTIDLVIALRFRSHPHSGKLAEACSAVDVPLAESYSYGLQAVVTAVTGALAWSRKDTAS